MSNFFKNTGLYIIGSILPQAAGFLLLPIYTRCLTPSDYGIVFSMQVFNSILSIFLTLAIERSLYRLYWDYESADERKIYLGSVVIALTIISTFSVVLIFMFHKFINLFFKSIPFYPFYVYAIFIAYFAVFEQVPKIYLQLHQKALHFVAITTLQFVTSTSIVLFYVLSLEEGAIGMLKGQMFSAAIFLPFFLVISGKIISFHVNISILRESLRFSLPMIPSLLSAWALNLSDRIFIERYFSMSDVGIYSLGCKISGLVLIVSSALHMAYSPIFFQLANAADQLISKKRLTLYNNIYVISIIFVCFVVCLFSKEVVLLFLDSRYSNVHKIIPFIIITILISQCCGPLNLAIYQEKKTLLLMIMSILCGLSNIILNFFLVRSYGAFGAAYSSSISFIMLFTAEYIYSKKCYFVEYNWKNIFIALILSCPFVFFSIFLDINIYLSLILKSVIIIVLFSILIYFYGGKIKTAFSSQY